MTPNKLPPLPETVKRVADSIAEFSDADVMPEWDTLDRWRDTLREALRQSQSLPAGAVAGSLYSDDDLRVIVQDWDDSDPGSDQCVAINLARELLDHRAATRQAQTSGHKLIGWRTSDYLLETTDRAVATSWIGNVEVLPIFEGDKNTRLATQPAQAVLKPNGD